MSLYNRAREMPHADELFAIELSDDVNRLKGGRYVDCRVHLASVGTAHRLGYEELRNSQ